MPYSAQLSRVGLEMPGTLQPVVSALSMDCVVSSTNMMFNAFAGPPALAAAAVAETVQELMPRTLTK